MVIWNCCRLRVTVIFSWCFFFLFATTGGLSADCSSLRWTQVRDVADGGSGDALAVGSSVTGESSICCKVFVGKRITLPPLLSLLLLVVVNRERSIVQCIGQQLLHGRWVVLCWWQHFFVGGWRCIVVRATAVAEHHSAMVRSPLLFLLEPLSLTATNSSGVTKFLAQEIPRLHCQTVRNALVVFAAAVMVQHRNVFLQAGCVLKTGCYVHQL